MAKLMYQILAYTYSEMGRNGMRIIKENSHSLRSMSELVYMQF